MSTRVYMAPEFSTAWRRPPEARLATWSEVQQDKFAKVGQAPATVWNAIINGQANDHQMARLDDVTRTLGVLGIATLGTLGVRQLGGGVPLWLGAASWLASMSITPAILKKLIQLKTGVNLNTFYKDSQGNTRWFYQDPNYIPLQITSQKQRNELYKSLNIPTDNPNRPNILTNKLKQIDVQYFTWWMLMAGIATPVGSALICDALENPVKDRVSQLRVWWSHQRRLKPALRTQDPLQKAAKMAPAVDDLIKTTLGTGTDVTPWARWWHELPRAVSKTLNLHKMPQSVLTHADPAVRYQNLVIHMTEQLQNPETREALSTLLQHKRASLGELLEPLYTVLDHPSVTSSLPRDKALPLRQTVTLADDTAKATLTHLENLLNIKLMRGAEPLNRALMGSQMEKSVLAVVEQLAREGDVTRAAKMSGSRGLFESIRGDLLGERFNNAFIRMGDSPKNFLMTAMEGLGKRRAWQRGFGWLLAGAMAAASVIYVTEYVGQDFDTPTPSKPTQPKKPQLKSNFKGGGNA